MTEHDDRPTAPRRTGRSTFVPVVLVGLAAAGLAAVAGAQPWVNGSSGSVDTASSVAVVSIDQAGVRESPLAASLALVVLACWGVLLVTRGVVRRVVAVLALLAALGLVLVTALAFGSLQDDLSEALLAASGTDTVEVGITGWYVAAAVGAVLSVLATAAAVRLVPAWPEMGSRYDTPTGAGGEHAPADVETSENLDIWKAIDEGHDPTQDSRPLD